MIQFSVWNDTEWLYPDSSHTEIKEACLHVPLGGHSGVQILGDFTAEQIFAKFFWENHAGPEVKLYQLLPVGVNENTSPTLMTTTDYESCRKFVTHKAPFDVFDALKPVDGSFFCEGRLAFYLCIEADSCQTPGTYSGVMEILIGKEKIMIPVHCTVHNVCIPALSEARLGMLNFFHYEGLSEQHQVVPGSEEYWNVFRNYVRAQIDMRCTHILLPPGKAVFQNDSLIGFDFSDAERAGLIALEEGAVMLCGGHVAHWQAWDSSEYYPNWDSATGITTPEGYLQMRLYFSQWAKVIEKNHWQECMTQALADEPQTHNDKTYRILASMFRKFLPGIPIIDAVETTNLGGGIDIWVPKQDTYEKWREDYEKLKNAGEEMWFYTCAFPAGPAMNRSMDLPLTVSRSVLWMGALYRLSGFLHWGFNYYIGQDIWHSACCPHKGALLPAGDAHIVYPGPGEPWRSMRFEAQRGGAEDYELLMQAMEISSAEVETLIRTVCTSFHTYSRSGADLSDARLKLIRFLEERQITNG